MKKAICIHMLSIMVLFFTGIANTHGGQEELGTLEEIEIQESEDFLKAVIGISGQFSYQHFELKDPSRLVVEITPIGEIRTEESYDVNAFGVRIVRTGRFRPDTARIVFDLVEVLPSYEIIQVTNGIEVVFRWVEDVDKVPPAPEIKIEPEEIPEAEVRTETHLRSVSYGRIDSQVKADIHIDGDFYYRSIELQQFSRLILDFWPIPLLSAKSISNINISGLRDIAVQKTGPETVRMVFSFVGMLSSFKIERKENGLSITFHAVEEPAIAVKEEIVRVEKIIYPPIENTMVSVTAGGYSTSDSSFNMIYGDMDLMYGFELTRIIARRDNGNFALTLGVSYFSTKGSSTLTKEDSEFTIIPFSISGEYLWNLDHFVPFFRLGLDINSYKEKSEYHEVSGSKMGTHFMIGMYLKIPKLEQLKFKFFVKLVFATVEEENVEIDIGGIEAGVGLTFGFNVL